ncbi:putative actin protein RO7 [Emericellopsis atlantica]|uniref:Actin protein RO7 n=1 Tax=Emericellopsis atlantica TaxID=2614577 RepID=A0A9P8CRT3_9HYPO|nr:putative actin protein RO7 [Emericellopsis atlantica]KAG9256662.1 putative actin protein RO7 [Emericellopsis atlantica]
MSSSAGFAAAHRSVASIRSGPSQGPSTPSRSISSTFGSPSTIRADDDIIVIELGSRLLRVGFAGDPVPKATLQCGPDEQRRVGDFRAWLDPTKTPGQAWSSEYELWRYDLSKVELGLVHDKLDRLMREAFSKFLLIDSKPRRMALVADPSLPLPLLSTVLDTAFGRFQAPMVSLLSPATMSAVAAGVRSALVIDIGWSETVVTSVYEYREVKTTRSVRAGKYFNNELYRKVLHPLIAEDQGKEANTVSEKSHGQENPTKEKMDRDRAVDVENEKDHRLSFDESEDIMRRLAWCRPTNRTSQRTSAQLETVEEQDENEAEAGSTTTPGADRTAHVPLQSSTPPKTIDVPFERIADVCGDVFFEPSMNLAHFDDHELPIHLLAYRHLAELPVDVRAICMSRVIFIGGCSNILGLKQRVIDETTSIIETKGWEPASGKAVDQLSNNSKLKWKPTKTPHLEQDRDEEDGLFSEQANDFDQFERGFMRPRKKDPPVQGHIRALHSVGPWTGASLACQLKIPAMATIDRELWLQQGVNGASRPNDVDVKAQQRQSMGAGGLIRGSGGQHTNWTLGKWGAI